MSNSNNGYEEPIDITKIRVRYSTLVNYVNRLFKLFIATVFTLIATRKLSIEEYGLWATLVATAGILAFIYDIWCYWVPRFYARGRRSVVSASFTLNLLSMPILAGSIVAIGYYTNSILGYGFTVFLVGSSMVIYAAFNRYLRHLVFGSRPFIEGYVNIIRESLRLLLAYLFVVLLSMRALGIVYSVIIPGYIAVVLYIVFLLKYGVKIPRPSLNRDNLLIIIKNSYIPLLILSSIMLTYVERPLLTFITATTIATAYLGVSSIPKSIVTQSTGSLVSGLRTRLLVEPSSRDVEDIFRLIIIINVFLTSILLVMGRPLLSLFKEQYMAAYTLYILYVLESFIISISNFFSEVSMSLERRDLYESGLSLARTPLAKLPFYRFMRSLIAIFMGIGGMIIVMAFGINDPILIALPYPLSWFTTSFAYLYISYRFSIQSLKYKVPLREITSAVIGSLTMALFLFINNAQNIVVKSFWIGLPVLAFYVAIGSAIYVGVVYLLSKWFRDFINNAVSRLPGFRR